MGILSMIKRAKKLGIVPRPPQPKPKPENNEKRATIREDARKPKNVSKPKTKTTKKPTMKDVAGPDKKTGFDIKKAVREKNKSLKLLNKRQRAKR